MNRRLATLTIGMALALSACARYQAPEARTPSEAANAEWLPYPTAAMRVFDSGENRSDPDPLLRWSVGTVRLSIDREHMPMLQQAIAEWQAPGLPRLVAVEPGSPCEITVQEAGRPNPRDADELGYAVPDAGDAPPWGPALTHASVLIRMRPGLSPREFQSVLTHEVGHALGFWRHTADPGLLMAAELPENARHVSKLERDTLVALYAAQEPQGWANRSPSLRDYLRKGLELLSNR